MRDSRVQRTERWFVRAALPQLIVDWSARAQVVPRMLPFLGAAALYWLLQAASVDAFVSLALPLILIVAVWPFTTGLSGRRPPRLTTAGVVTVIVAFGVVFVVGGVLAHAARPGAFGTSLAGVAAPRWLIVGFIGLVLYAAAFAGGYLATAYGVVPALKIAVGDLAKGLSDVPRSFGRSLPVVLFGTLFLFFTGELWQLLDRLSWPRVWLVLVLLTVIVALATWRVVKGYDENPVGPEPTEEDFLEACRGTPLEGAAAPGGLEPLEHRQELNVLVLLTVRQLVQAAILGVGLFLFFVALGLITVQYETAAVWIGHAPQRSGLFGVPMALFKLSALLASFGGVSFATTSMTNSENRQEFFLPVLRTVRRPILVHAVYRSLASTDKRS